MNFRFILAFGLIGWLASGPATARAESPVNPYTPIVERNMFGLVPIPTNNPAADLPPPTPPPKITPNGIMTLFGKVQVLFKVAGTPKAGQAAKDESYVLGVGERQDEIEVQKIDEPSATITFNNHGTIQELSLVTANTGGGAGAPAVAPAGFGLPATTPLVMPGAVGMPTAIGGGGRFGRSRPSLGGGNPSAVLPAPGFGGNTTATSAAETQAAISPEAQVIMMEAQRAKWLSEGNPAAAIIPPTPMTPQVTGEGAPSSPPIP